MYFVTELSITEKCNLGCPYCYVANKDSFMTKQTLDITLEKLKIFSKKAGCDGVHISWFGGEPLLNWDLLMYAIPKVRALGWSQNIISNMTLIEPYMTDFCKKHNVGFSWSFDGIDANKSRPLLKIPENHGYRKILDIYTAKKDLILSVCRSCKVMIYPGNFKGMDKNLDFFINWGITSPDFTLVRDAIWSTDDVNEFKIEARKLAERWMEYIQQGTRCSVGFFMLYILDTIFGITHGKRPFGCFACSHGCSVASNGDFYPCARFAAKNIMKYDENHNFQYYAKLLNPQNYAKCKACDLYYICNAGCTYSQLREGNIPVPAICDLLHILYAESARIVNKMKHNKLFRDIIKTSLKHTG